jgi:hypothetical protein
MSRRSRSSSGCGKVGSELLSTFPQPGFQFLRFCMFTKDTDTNLQKRSCAIVWLLADYAQIISEIILGIFVIIVLLATGQFGFIGRNKVE